MDLCSNLENWTRKELEEQYLLLQQKNKQLSDASEVDAQRIYDLKRNLQTAAAAELYLSQELEQLTLSAQQGANTKLQSEHDDLRRKHFCLSSEFATLQDNCNTILEENRKLRSQIESLAVEKEKTCNKEKDAYNDQLIERLSVLEQENFELLQKLDELKAERMQQTMALAEKEKKIELMQDEVSCLEENMRYKREELEEKTRMVESAQEQLFEANSKINMLMSSPDNKDRKGNSLFAEVDDQRQVMKQLLAAQKKSYHEMKKIYNESQYEIRRLKRENMAMHTELQACSKIFCNADRTYQEKLNNRIKHLLCQNENLEEKLKLMQQQLKDIATDKGVLWLDSMLNFCKRETDDLKEQLHSLIIKNASLEEQHRLVQQDMVRWRFEALKSRCLLINRENLLTENNIDFKPQNDVEFKITEDEEKKSRPRIVPSSTLKVASNISSTHLVNEDIKENVESKNICSLSTICLNESIDCNIENVSSSDLKEGSVFEEEVSLKSETCGRKILKEINPTMPENPIESFHKTMQSELEGKQSEKMRLPSILCKNREVVNLNEEKTVKFAANATIHNIPETPVKCDYLSEESNMKSEETPSDSNAKIIRTKSNVVVRRFVLGSRPK